MECTNKTRLFQITTSLDPKLGGPTNVVIGTYKFLNENFDHKLIIFGQASIEISDCVNIPTFRNNRYGFTLRRMRSMGFLESRDSDIILIHGFYLYSTLISLFFFNSMNIFLMPHGALEEYQEKFGRLRKRVFRIFLKILLRNREIHFLVGSDAEKISILKLYPNAKISVVGLGIELANLPTARPHSVSRPIRLFCMSRISTKKRIDLCILALKKLNSQEIRYTLEIIGSGEPKLESALRKLVSELRLEQEVKFSGFLEGSEKTSAMFDSDIFLLPSENENFAIAVAESIAAGRPVVVSNFVAMHEFVEKYRTGITLDSLQVEDLVNAIEIVSENYAQFQKNCLDSLHLLGWEIIQNSWLRTLKNTSLI